ncbi:MAG: sigma-54-dependent Fis family transcriptional regulator [Nitrospira sp.]|nr:sigma-54-dependent Fis family transcriptional regulator [Nitrospira sp.]
MAESILIVDDEPAILTALSKILEDEGYHIATAKSGQEALTALANDPPDLMMLDIWMPELDGIETLKRSREQVPQVQVLMMSGHGNIETAVKAIKLGAYDFIEKPLSLENVMLRVRHALDQRRLQEENKTLRYKVERQFELIGTSPAMQQLRALITTAGPSNARVLIGGENGTGKELVARAIHQHSPRADKPFTAVNCAAIPETLIESELLGHEKGAFTGATGQKRGQFEQANSGTLFLDEIGDMSLNTQAKVLRVLQEQQFMRVGGTKAIKVDVRVIAASNKDLQAEIKKGNFREDLYYRLNVVPIEVPPLRERKQDLRLLVQHFLKTHAEEQKVKPKGITAEALVALEQYDWPGNIRELRNLIERLMIMVPEATVEAAHIGPLIQSRSSSVGGAATASSPLTSNNYDSLKDARNAFERDYISRKLREHNWNVSKTADALQIERSHLHRKIKLLSVELRHES